MSVYTLKLPFLQISPKVWVENSRLVAKTSTFYRILNAFFYSRTVIIDKEKKKIDTIIKIFWFFKSSDCIPFDDLNYVDISRYETGKDFGLTPGGFGARDITEIFYVQIRTKSNPLPTNLFRFVGNGGRYNGWFGVLLGDSAIDSEGRQYEKACKYAEQVSEFTGIPLWQNRKVQLSLNTVQKYECTNCGHLTSSIQKKCTYCGFYENRET